MAYLLTKVKAAGYKVADKKNAHGTRIISVTGGTAWVRLVIGKNAPREFHLTAEDKKILLSVNFGKTAASPKTAVFPPICFLPVPCRCLTVTLQSMKEMSIRKTAECAVQEWLFLRIIVTESKMQAAHLPALVLSLRYRETRLRLFR